MTEKDHALIAAEMKQVKRSFIDKFAHKEYNNGKYDAWYIIAVHLACALEKDNPHFAKEKFLKDCGC
jgi:hypothetical protein